jgi:hypothetical protein
VLQNPVCHEGATHKPGSNQGFPPGNGPARAVHLTTATSWCVRRVRVDLGVLRWYQKRAGLVGVLPILGRGLYSYAGCFTPAGVNVKCGACRKLDHR